MPVSVVASYTAPWFLPGAHVQTIYPALFRRVRGLAYRRRRLELADGDFMDLDWSRLGRSRVAILLHGLASCSEASYMRGMTRALNANGYDTVCVNYRGCSGEPNRLPRMYHSGSTDDLDAVVQHVITHHDYSMVALVGFSLGGNIVLKYLGERGTELPPTVRGGAAVSVPCDLRAAAYRLAEPVNRLYMDRFLRILRRRFEAKRAIMPADFDWRALRQVQSFLDYDELFTAPLHGFAGAEEYWRLASSANYVAGIRAPALLINAINDPFFPASSHPVDVANENEWFHLEQPSEGGHLGFTRMHRDRMYWHESRVVRFFEQVLEGTSVPCGG